MAAPPAPALRLVLVRGTNGTALADVLEPVAERVAGAYPGPVRTESLDYPATADIRSYEWPVWVSFGGSVEAGVRSLAALLEEHARTDPGSPVVVVGFSQGGLVVTETLARVPDRAFSAGAPELSAAALASLRLAVSFGNPSFCPGESFNGGTPLPGVGGVCARRPGVLAHAADRLADLVEHDDVAAQHVPTGSLAGHLSYAARGYVPLIADGILSRLTGART